MKIALVTGSSRGIGLGIARRLAQDGWHVVCSATAKENPELLERLAQEGIEADYVGLNVSDPEQREAALAWILSRFGRIDLLVNNAGVAPLERRDVLETTVDSFRRVLGINLEGCFFMCQLFAGEMIRECGLGLPEYRPRIVNISSMSAYTSSTSRGEYCISKAGISMCTKLFADRLAEFGIPVFEVRPGIILTDMTAGVREKYEKLIAEGVTPIRRFGTPEDVAACVAAAAGGDLDFATGQVLDADGGFHIRRL